VEALSQEQDLAHLLSKQKAAEEPVRAPKAARDLLSFEIPLFSFQQKVMRRSTPTREAARRLEG
jgi:hypothetical protein